MDPKQSDSSVQHALQRGLKHQQAGDLAQAEGIYRSVLAAEPENPEALHLLGTIATQVGKPEIAVKLIQKAIGLRPSNAHFFNNLGNALKALGRLEDAERSYRQALKLNPGSPHGYYNLGGTLDPLGRTADAEDSYRKALVLKPDLVEAHYNLGNLLQRLRRFTEAAECYRQVLALRPNYPEAHNNLGNTFKDLGRIEEAERCFGRALRLKPDYAYAHYNLGTMLHDRGRLKEAEAHYRKAVAIDVDLAEAHYNLGNLLRALLKPEEAERSYRKAIALKPTHPEAHYNLGMALQALGRPAEAERSYRQALTLKPDYIEAHCLWVHQCQHLCDWSRLEREANSLCDKMRQGTSPRIFPFTFLALPETSPAEQYQCARQFAEAEFRNFISGPAICGSGLDRDRKRLRIGYLSADFHDHATSYLLPEVIERHDRRRFEVYGYSYGVDDGSATGRRIRAAFNALRDVSGVTDEIAARQIFADEIDILIDLKGYTANARVQICALRPAPVQVSWLGYPGTLGLPRLADYIIGDSIVSPLQHAERYSELLALMPHCYQPNDRKRAVGAVPTRAEAGLPQSGVLFCCFNRSYKLTPTMLDIWCRLLREVPGSIIWLLQTSTAAQENIAREVTTRGITADRIFFAPKLPLSQHLGRLQLADLALDTFPVTSHTTASDALWAGVPLITLVGETFVSRVAASILNAAGLPELVTTDYEAYYRLAFELATQPRQLNKLKTRLAKNRMNCPLFDSQQFTRDLEQLYERMWQDYREGKREHIVADGKGRKKTKRRLRA